MGAQAATPGSAMMMNLMPIIIIFLVFYFLSIRPQMNKQKAHQKMLENLKRGDRVVTNGGIYGTIVDIQQNVLRIKISEGVNIQILKSAVLMLSEEDKGSVPEIAR